MGTPKMDSPRRDLSVGRVSAPRGPWSAPSQVQAFAQKYGAPGPKSGVSCDPSFRGQYAFYGPTLNYDGLAWRKGRWHFSTDVAVKNGEDSSPREYRDPSRRRRRS